MSEAKACISCGSHHVGKFCANCGEKRPSQHDYSIVHFFEHVFEAFTHFDFKSFRAFRFLLAKPGFLTREYLDGRRKVYIGPVQLFIIANVVFALFGPTTFRTPLLTQLSNPPFVSMKREKATEVRVQRGMTEEAFRESFDFATTLQSKTWIFFMIPMFALCLVVLYGFRRYVFEHLVFATHFYAFALLWILASVRLTGVALILTSVSLTPQGIDDVSSLATLVGIIVFLVPALRRAYGGGTAASVVRALTLGVLFFPIVMAYRFLLFFVTLRAMH